MPVPPNNARTRRRASPFPHPRSTTYGAEGRGSVCNKLANRASSTGEHSRRSRWARFDHLSRASESTSEILPDEVTLPTKAVGQGTSMVGNHRGRSRTSTARVPHEVSAPSSPRERAKIRGSAYEPPSRNHYDRRRDKWSSTGQNDTLRRTQPSDLASFLESIRCDFTALGRVAKVDQCRSHLAA